MSGVAMVEMGCCTARPLLLSITPVGVTLRLRCEATLTGSRGGVVPFVAGLLSLPLALTDAFAEGCGLGMSRAEKGLCNGTGCTVSCRFGERGGLGVGVSPCGTSCPFAHLLVAACRFAGGALSWSTVSLCAMIPWHCASIAFAPAEGGSGERDFLPAVGT